MYALTVTVHILEDSTKIFLQKTLECALATQKESGNVRYDILQSEDDPSCFVIYEVYLTKEDFCFIVRRPILQSGNQRQNLLWQNHVKESVVTASISAIKQHTYQ